LALEGLLFEGDVFADEEAVETLRYGAGAALGGAAVVEVRGEVRRAPGRGVGASCAEMRVWKLPTDFAALRNNLHLCSGLAD